MKTRQIVGNISVALAVVACSSSQDKAGLPASGSDGPSYNSGDTTGYGDDQGLAIGDGDGSSYSADPYSSDADSQSPEDGTAGAANDVPLDPVGTNPFVIAAHDPLSTFAVDVDTASYDLFRSYTEQGSAVPSHGIRLEDFVNYFEYDYAPPEDTAEAPFSIHLSAAPNLATRDTKLFRVGIQGAVVEEMPAANLVFLVDISGSMSEELATVKQLLKAAVNKLKPQDRVAIVTYAASPGTPLPSTPVSEKETILDAIDSLVSDGATNGSGGLNAAYAEANAGFLQEGINHILLCTDGDFNLGLTADQDLEELVEEKRSSGVTLTAVGFGGGNFNDAMMERISNIGNGIYSYIGSSLDATRYAEQRLLQSMIHIAKDVKIQVEFNPAYVHAYRLLGYENRAIADDDFRDDLIDAGEIGSGHRVTALYELAFSENDLPNLNGSLPLDDGEAFIGHAEVNAEDFVLVKVRYKAPGAAETDAASEVSSTLTPNDVDSGFAATASDFQYAAAVATYAEILKGSPFADRSALDAIELILNSQKDKDSERAEFYSLFQQANEINGLNP